MASWWPVPHWDAINKLRACLGSFCFCSHRRLFCTLLVPQLRAYVSLRPHSSSTSPYRVTSYWGLEGSQILHNGGAGASPTLPPSPKFPHCRGGTFRMHLLQEGAAAPEV